MTAILDSITKKIDVLKHQPANHDYPISKYYDFIFSGINPEGYELSSTTKLAVDAVTLQMMKTDTNVDFEKEDIKVIINGLDNSDIIEAFRYFNWFPDIMIHKTDNDEDYFKIGKSILTRDLIVEVLSSIFIEYLNFELREVQLQIHSRIPFQKWLDFFEVNNEDSPDYEDEVEKVRDIRFAAIRG